MKIGDLAAATDTSVESIRYYEREGLLPVPARTEGNYREYDEAHAQRLQFIRRCRALDMTLDEVRALLRFIDAPQGDCAGVNALLDEHLGHVRQRIAELRRLERELQQLRAMCDAPRSADDCGILRGLAQPGTPRRMAPGATRRPVASSAHRHDDLHRPKAAAR